MFDDRESDISYGIPEIYSMSDELFRDCDINNWLRFSQNPYNSESNDIRDCIPVLNKYLDYQAIDLAGDQKNRNEDFENFSDFGSVSKSDANEIIVFSNDKVDTYKETEKQFGESSSDNTGDNSSQINLASSDRKTVEDNHSLFIRAWG